MPHTSIHRDFTTGPIPEPEEQKTVKPVQPIVGEEDDKNKTPIQKLRDKVFKTSSGETSIGRLSEISNFLKQVKKGVTAGDITVSEFLDLNTEFIPEATQITGSIAGEGSARASEVNPIFGELQSLGFVQAVGGQWVPQLPFSTREFAQLDSSVLPSLDDVNKGIFPAELLPSGGFDRIQRNFDEGEATRAAEEKALKEQELIDNPPLDSDTGELADEGPVTQVPDPNNPGEFIDIPLVGKGVGPVTDQSIDQRVIENENRRQQEQLAQAFNAQRSLRTTRLEDLGGLLRTEQQRQEELGRPLIQEQLQGQGLLRSSALGEALSRQGERLTGARENILGQQAISDREAEVQGIGDILARSQGLQTAGLGRRFSVEDFQREFAAAQTLGSQATPQVGSAGSNILTGAFSGAGSGALIGSAFGGPGAAIGGGAGALVGAIGEATYLCTKLRELKLITEDEVQAVHAKVFTKDFGYCIALIIYGFFAPRFIKRMEKKDFDWSHLKKQLCDDVLATHSSEEAFTKYSDVCANLFAKEFPWVSFLFSKNILHKEIRLWQMEHPISDFNHSSR